MVFLGPAASAGTAAATRFRVGIAAPTVNMLPLWMGQEAGLFKARGLAVEIVNTDGGSRGLAEVGAGRLEAMTVGLSSVIDANGNIARVTIGKFILKPTLIPDAQLVSPP